MKRFIFFVFLLFLITISLLFPEITYEGVKNGIYISVYKIAPSLFVFLVLTNMLVSSEYFFKLMNPVFSLFEKIFCIPKNACVPLILGLICGFPVGARTAKSMYENDEISFALYNRLLLFVNSVSPAFLISAVGLGIYSDERVGYFLFFCQFLCVLLLAFVSLFFYKTPIQQEKFRKKKKSDIFTLITESISTSLSNILIISSYVIFFSFITGFLKFLPIKNDLISALIFGLFEMSCGVFAVKRTSFSGLLCICFIIGFGGLCIHMQTVAILGESRIKLSKYLFFKLLNGALLCLFCLVFYNLLL